MPVAAAIMVHTCEKTESLPAGIAFGAAFGILSHLLIDCGPQGAGGLIDLDDKRIFFRIGFLDFCLGFVTLLLIYFFVQNNYLIFIGGVIGFLPDLDKFANTRLKPVFENRFFQFTLNIHALTHQVVRDVKNPLEIVIWWIICFVGGIIYLYHVCR